MLQAYYAIISYDDVQLYLLTWKNTMFYCYVKKQDTKYVRHDLYGHREEFGKTSRGIMNDFHLKNNFQYCMNSLKI